MQRRKSVSRIFELIVGGLGALISLVSSSFILLIGSFGFGATSFLGLIATDVGGFLFIVSAILVLLGSTFFGVLGAVLLLVAGMSALFRK